MGGRRDVSIISRRPVTSRDLKQERSFFPYKVSVIGSRLYMYSCVVKNLYVSKYIKSELLKRKNEQNYLFKCYLLINFSL